MSTGSIRPDRSERMTEVSRSESTCDGSSRRRRRSSHYWYVLDAREREGTARHSYYGCWSTEASIEVAGYRLRVERGRAQLTVGVASALCVTIDAINYRRSAGFHRNWWIWMNFGIGGWSSMFCVKHRFSLMISFTDNVALFIDVITWFHRWFFPFGTRWVFSVS